MTEQLHALLDSFRKSINNDRFDYSYERNYNDVIEDLQRRLAKVSPFAPVTAGDVGEGVKRAKDAYDHMKSWNSRFVQKNIALKLENEGIRAVLKIGEKLSNRLLEVDYEHSGALREDGQFWIRVPECVFHLAKEHQAAIAAMHTLSPHEADAGLSHTIDLLDELRKELETQFKSDVLSSWPWANLYSAIHNMRLRMPALPTAPKQEG